MVTPSCVGESCFSGAPWTRHWKNTRHSLDQINGKPSPRASAGRRAFVFTAIVTDLQHYQYGVGTA